MTITRKIPSRCHQQPKFCPLFSSQGDNLPSHWDFDYSQSQALSTSILTFLSVSSPSALPEAFGVPAAAFLLLSLS